MRQQAFFPLQLMLRNAANANLVSIAKMLLWQPLSPETAQLPAPLPFSAEGSRTFVYMEESSSLLAGPNCTLQKRLQRVASNGKLGIALHALGGHSNSIKPFRKGVIRLAFFYPGTKKTLFSWQRIMQKGK